MLLTTRGDVERSTSLNICRYMYKFLLLVYHASFLQGLNTVSIISNFSLPPDVWMVSMATRWPPAWPASLARSTVTVTLTPLHRAAAIPTPGRVSSAERAPPGITVSGAPSAFTGMPSRGPAKVSCKHWSKFYIDCLWILFGLTFYFFIFFFLNFFFYLLSPGKGSTCKMYTKQINIPQMCAWG